MLGLLFSVVWLLLWVAVVIRLFECVFWVLSLLIYYFVVFDFIAIYVV